MSSTLLRETNPANNRIAGFLPQHADANGTYVPTGETYPMPVQVNFVKGMLPTQVQGQLMDYDITHTNVSIAPNSWSAQTDFRPTNGAKFLAVHLANDSSATSISAEIAWSNDGVTADGKTIDVANTNLAVNKSGMTQALAPYYRVNIKNLDTAAAPAGNHTVNCKVTKLYG
jgi:hypothetical protein